MKSSSENMKCLFLEIQGHGTFNGVLRDMKKEE
jgi:hypothetical protein